MQFLKRLSILLTVYAVFSFIFSPSSYAYLDPGSGSYLLQIALAGLLTVSFMFKSFWMKIINFFKKLFSKKTADKK